MQYFTEMNNKKSNNHYISLSISLYKLSCVREHMICICVYMHAQLCTCVYGAQKRVSGSLCNELHFIYLFIYWHMVFPQMLWKFK